MSNIIYKYSFLDNSNHILKSCENLEIREYISNMINLIEYQMKEIRDQRTEIIRLKHKYSWVHYDRPMDQYDTEQRKYIDKPPKSGNMSC